MDYKYDIRNFFWNKELNTFFAQGWDLVAELPDGSIHPEAFPNGKEEFYIHNYQTGGFRRFRFVDTLIEHYVDTYEDGSFSEFEVNSLLFESEDGIKCNIIIS